MGRAGEKSFSLQCSNSGVTANPAAEDDYGWDFHLEFPPGAQSLVPLDMRAGRTEALVQIKATEGNGRSVPIRLSNALHSVQSSLPNFIILMVFKDGAPRYFVKHVWLPLIGEWLKAARIADSEGVSAPNRQDIRIRFEDEDEHTEDLLEWMQAEVRKVSAPYGGTKDQIVKTIGFDRVRGIAEVNLPIDGPEAYLDLQLGLLPAMFVNRLTIFSERFGIRASSPEVDVENVHLKLTPEGVDGILHVHFPKGERVVIPAKAFGAAADGLQAWRVATRCFDIIHGPHDRIRVNAKLNETDLLPLDEIALFSNLKAAKAGSLIDIEFEMKGQLLGLGSISFQIEDQIESWGWLALGAKTLNELGHQSSKSLPDLRVSDMNDAGSTLHVLSALVSDYLLRMDFYPKKGIPDRYEAVLAYSFARIGDLVFAAVARRPIIHDGYIGKKRQIGFGTGRILQTLVVEAHEWSPTLVEQAYDRHLERMASEGDILALGNLHKVATDKRRNRVIKSDLPKKRRTSSKSSE